MIRRIIKTVERVFHWDEFGTLDPAPAQNVGSDLGRAAHLAENFDLNGMFKDDLPKGWAGCRRKIAEAIRALAPTDHVKMVDALRLVVAYDELLRSYEGPSNTLFAGDVVAIDAAYDEMVAAVRSAIAASEVSDV